MLRATQRVLRRGYGLRLAPQCHGLSTAAAKRTLTLEEAMTSSHMILQTLQAPTTVAQLTSVRNAPDTLTKWQQSNATLVQATLHVLPQVGFSHDLQGLQAYTEAFAQHMRTEQPETRKALEALNEQKWAVLLKHAFDCEPAPAIGISDARELAIALVDGLQDPTLLRQERPEIARRRGGEVGRRGGGDGEM